MGRNNFSDLDMEVILNGTIVVAFLDRLRLMKLPYCQSYGKS